MEPNIKIITSWQETNEDFYAPGALIEVVDGKGTLQEVFMELMDEKSYWTLIFGEKPLFQLQGGEYFCPTCEKIMKSGYGLEQSEEFYNQVINATKEEVSFEAALESMKPLLGLLQSKYYIVLDTSLYPTDGNGHLFWEIPNENVELPGTCIYYFREKGFTWGKLRPYFTVATQPVEKLSKERVEHYRKAPGARAIAYYMDGYMTALLDGHHKTMAAALEGRMVNALVIIPCYPMAWREGEILKRYIGMGGMKFACDEYGLCMKEQEPVKHPAESEKKELLQNILSQIPQAPLQGHLPYDTEELVKPYPNVRDLAYMDLVGEITDERIDRILSQQDRPSGEEAADLVTVLGILLHNRLREVADFYLNQHYIDRDIIIACFEALVRLPHTDELDTYLIEQMVEHEENHSIVKDIVMDYF